jgi:hypothetical protein
MLFSALATWVSVCKSWQDVLLKVRALQIHVAITAFYASERQECRRPADERRYPVVMLLLV